MIRRDSEGRYCLNDLHRAAGGKNSDRPSLWFVNKGTKSLIEELGKDGFTALVTVQGGEGGGSTYVCKELVYSYAMCP